MKDLKFSMNRCQAYLLNVHAFFSYCFYLYFNKNCGFSHLLDMANQLEIGIIKLLELNRIASLKPEFRFGLKTVLR